MNNEQALESKPMPGQPITVPPPPPVRVLNDFADQIGELAKTAGTIDLSKEQEEILFDPIDPDDVEIRPDGLIYVPWMGYVTRLRKAFKMKWSVIPQGMPLIKGNLILWGFYLIVEGKYVGFALGEQTYFANNDRMSYGDACEGAKSNALMRLCKGIGIGLDLWKPSFVKGWKEKHAEMGKDKNGKIAWRRKVGRETDPILAQNPVANGGTAKDRWDAVIEMTREHGIDIKTVLTELGIEAATKSNLVQIEDKVRSLVAKLQEE